MIFEMMTSVVSSLNGLLPEKTLSTIQTLGEPSTTRVERHVNRPLSQPSQRQTRPIPVRSYQLPQESPVLSMPRCTRPTAPESSFREQPRKTRNPSNEHDRRDRQGCRACLQLSVRSKTTLKNTCPSQVSVCGVVCVKIVETFGDIQ